jgi:hypothetical protein
MRGTEPARGRRIPPVQLQVARPKKMTFPCLRAYELITRSNACVSFSPRVHTRRGISIGLAWNLRALEVFLRKLPRRLFEARPSDDGGAPTRRTSSQRLSVLRNNGLSESLAHLSLNALMMVVEDWILTRILAIGRHRPALRVIPMTRWEQRTTAPTPWCIQ